MEFQIFLFTILASLIPVCLACQGNPQPVIGILTEPTYEDAYPDSNFIAASYVKLVEMFGGRVVPIFPNQTDTYYQFLAKRLNGVIYPGGGVNLYASQYHRMAKIFYDYSLNLMDTKQEKFPILGVCLGFEELATLAANGTSVVLPCDSENHLNTQELTEYGREQSDVFSYAPSWLLMAMEDAALAPNFHKYGLLESTFGTNSDLQNIFKVVSYSWDRDNQKYVAIMESDRYPLLALQHHPEKNLFEWGKTLNLAHHFWGAAYSQFLGDYYIQTSRSSCQRFDSEDQLVPFLIYNYPVTYSQYLFEHKQYTQMYIFSEDAADNLVYF